MSTGMVSGRPRFYPSEQYHGLWFAAFDPHIHVLSVTDDFGNLVPVYITVMTNDGICLKP